MTPDINYVAVLVAAAAQFAIGAAWYTALFGKQWLKLNGISKEKVEAQKDNMAKTYALSFVTSLVMAYVLAHVLGYSNATTALAGATGGFWVWLGFIATTMFSSVLYLQKPVKLWAIDSGYYLVSLLVMGAVLAVWR